MMAAVHYRLAALLGMAVIELLQEHRPAGEPAAAGHHRHCRRGGGAAGPADHRPVGEQRLLASPAGAVPCFSFASRCR